MTVKIAPEAAFDAAAAATTTKQTMQKNEIIVASNDSLDALKQSVKNAADETILKKARRPLSAPSSRVAPAPEAMETFTPRTSKVRSGFKPGKREAETRNSFLHRGAQRVFLGDRECWRFKRKR